MATIEEYNEYKRDNKSEHAQRSTDLAIINFLGHALCSKILVDDVPDNTTQATNAPTQDPSPVSTLQSRVYHQPSPELEIRDDDFETMTISGDLSEHVSHADTNNSATPEDHLNHFHERASSAHHVSMTYSETLDGEEMFELADQDSHEAIKSVEWEH